MGGRAHDIQSMAGRSVDGITKLNDHLEVRTTNSYKTGFGGQTHFGRKSIRTRRDVSQRGTPAVEVLDVESLKRQNDILINGIRSLPQVEDDPNDGESYQVKFRDESRLGLIKV